MRFFRSLSPEPLDFESEKLLSHDRSTTHSSSRRRVPSCWSFGVRACRWALACLLALIAVAVLLSLRSYEVYMPCDLRILALGDSITFGGGAADTSSYRLRLQQALDRNGSRVHYVGAVRSGHWPNNRHEGHSGFTIQGIADNPTVMQSLQQEPNVVLLHAGTNDMTHSPPPEPVAGAPERLGALIDRILGASPEATVLVAQVISANLTASMRRIPPFNDAIPAVVAKRAKLGFKVAVVDMSDIGRTGLGLADGLHPNDMGYSAMAMKWYSALEVAQGKGWITPPR